MTELDAADQNQFTATLLRASSGGLASAAAHSLLSDEALKVSGGQDAFPQWRTALETHLSHLSTAIQVGRIEVFLDHILWSKWACLAREVSVDELRASLLALKATLLEELPQRAGEACASMIDKVLGPLEMAPDEPPSALTLPHVKGEHAARYLVAILEGDRDRALAVIDQAREEGMPIPDLYGQVFLPALAEVGRLWLLGEVHVAEEHFATATTSLAISRLHPHLPREENCGKTVVTVSIEGELHELGIRIVSEFFTMDGWRVVHLGSNVPSLDLRRGLIDFDADLVAISASITTHLSSVATMIRELRQDPQTQSLPVIVGGGAFRAAGDYWREIGADGQAMGPKDAVSLARKLVGLEPR